MKNDLFVGITTWNSELLLAHCLRSIRRTTDSLRVRIGVVDNMSTDRSVEIARDMGVQVHEERCSQAIGLNRLLAMSDAKHTLLIHSDVILLSSDWYATCSRHLTGTVALVSPEDIGYGPLTRPYGAGKPESRFMFFDTQKAMRAFTPEYWSEDLGHLRYGMGNFYSVDDQITHYHNWFDRVPKDVPMESRETTEGNGKGLPDTRLRPYPR